jgi:cell division protein FtsW
MQVNKNNLFFDLKVLLLLVLILLLAGLIFIYSASSVFSLEKFGDATYFVKKHMIGLFLGLVAMIICSLFPIKLLQKLVPIFFFASLFMTALTLIPSLSLQIHGSRRWVSLFGFVFQPSELLKFSLITYVAYLFDRKYQRSSLIHGYLPILIILGISAAILLKQPDFGLTVVLSATVFILLFIAQFRTIYLLFTAISAIPFGAFLIVFKSYRLKRILTFLDPWQDPKGAGFQIIQSLIAIGSGNFWGIGISNSKQKFFYLPMQHTDFIFSIIAEETGFIGSSILIFLFMLFLYFGLRLSWQLKDNFFIFSSLGFIILISLQAIINFCVAIGIFPTKGIGLPFVSYGNSALICNFAMIGLIINFVRSSKYCN